MGVPPGILGDGMVKVASITTFAGTLAATAAIAGEDLTCYFTSDGFNRAINQAAVTDERMCTTQSGEEPGRYTESLDVMYVWDQQNVTPTDNKAYTTLTPGSKKFFVVRYGMPFDTPFAAAQKVDVIAIGCGRQGRNQAAANEKLKISQKLFIPAGGVSYDLALT